MLKVENITKMFNKNKGIQNITFEAKEGRILGILGRNGAGKSTLFRCILNVLESDKGEVTLNDKKIDFDVLDNVGYLIEEGSLTAEYTVYDQFQNFGIIKNMSNDEIEESLIYWLDKFNISEYINYKIKNISKGNRQKLQFIVAVLHNPKLLILDEPFSGLDPISVEELKNVILELKKQGKIIIFSSHRLDQTENLCDDIVLIHNNEVLLKGRVNDIKTSMNKKKIVVIGQIDTDKLDKTNIYNILNIKDDVYEIYVDGNENASLVSSDITKQEINHLSIEDLSLEDIFKEKAGEIYE